MNMAQHRHRHRHVILRTTTEHAYQQITWQLQHQEEKEQDLHALTTALLELHRQQSIVMQIIQIRHVHSNHRQ